jgi:isopentenyl diphosphate isomerase/L-lactate dehydrogenase-like FMN-dependent dehydrogenase
MKKNTLNAYNIADLRELARRRLPKGIFEAIDRGSEDEVALRNNRQAFERIKLKPRRLVNVSNRSQAITLFGQKQKMPIVVAPTGTTGQMW